MDKKYYVLLLNNCYDTTSHYVSLYPFSSIPNVLKGEYTSLENVSEDFMELDDTITLKDGYWVVEGSFPVFAFEKDKKIYDLITLREIPYSHNGKDIEGVSYCKKYPIYEKMMQLMISLLDDESIERYTKGLNKLSHHYESSLYYKVTYKDINDIKTITTRLIDNQLISISTNKKMYLIQPDTISKKVGYDKSQQIDINEALLDGVHSIDSSNYNEAEHCAVKKYHDYIEFTKNNQKGKIKKRG